MDLIGALRAGLPPCAGVAVGFDRLLMLHEGKSDIAEVSNFVI
jgi:lysyl-tRNA synthetase class 2